jgi:ABC-type transporter MlaC component
MYSIQSTLDSLKKDCKVEISKQALIYHLKKFLKPDIDYILMNQYVLTKTGYKKVIDHYLERYPNGKT